MYGNLNESNSPFVIPISLRELIYTLKAKKVIYGYVLTDSIELPPSTALNYTVPIQSLKPATPNNRVVAIPLEFAAFVAPDYQIHGTFSIDNIVLIDDTAMVSDLYTKPFDFLTQYALSLYAKETLSAKFMNTSSTDSAKVSFRTVFGVMSERDYNKIVSTYADKINNYFLALPDKPLNW